MKMRKKDETGFTLAMFHASDVLNHEHDSDEALEANVSVSNMRDVTIGELIVSGRGLSDLECEMIQAAARYKIVSDLNRWNIAEIAGGEHDYSEAEISLLKEIVAGLKPYEPDDEEEVD